VAVGLFVGFRLGGVVGEYEGFLVGKAVSFVGRGVGSGVGRLVGPGVEGVGLGVGFG